MANASHKGMGTKGTGAGAGTDGVDTLGQADIAAEMMGSARLGGADGARHHNQRQIDADAKLTPDAGVLDAAEMDDKDVRAARELNKGGGVHPGMKQGGVS
jgi:hypothetical protein